MKFKDVVGNISAGSLGYIFNGRRGAKSAIGAYNSLRKLQGMKTPNNRKQSKINSHKKKNHGLSLYKKKNSPPPYSGKRKAGYSKSIGPRKLFKSANRFAANQLQSISQHNDWAKRPFKHLYLSRRSIKTVGVFYFDHSAAFVATGQNGTQKVQDLGRMMILPQLTGVTSNDTVNFNNNWATDPFLLNPYSTAPTNTIYPGPQPAVSAADKLCIKTIDHNLRLLSMVSIPQRVKLMYFLCKKAVGSTVLSTWANAMTAAALTQVVQAPANAFAVTTMTPGFGGTSSIGEVPMRWSAFRQFFKLIDEDQFILQPGDQIEINRKIHVNKVITKQYLNSISAADTYIAGLSVVPMIIVDGQLVGLSTALGVASLKVTPGETKVGWMQKDKYVFGALPVNRFVTQRLETGYLVNDVVEVEKQLNDVDGVALELSV